jgi:pimeloyl-ACP methyl ester carboxylesterase
VSAVLLVHDVGGTREALLPLASRLQKSGFAVLAIDLRGHGESATSEFTWAKLDPEGQTKAWSAMPADVKAGVDFLGGQKGVMPTRVSMVSSGAGAGLIARQAVRDERVRELVLIDPKAEMFGQSIVKDFQKLAGGIPTLLVVGKGDLSSGKRLIDAVSQTGIDVKTMDLKAAKLETAQILTDKSMYGDVSRWMLDKLQPKAALKN